MDGGNQAAEAALAETVMSHLAALRKLRSMYRPRLMNVYRLLLSERNIAAFEAALRRDPSFGETKVEVEVVEGNVEGIRERVLRVVAAHLGKKLKKKTIGLLTVRVPWVEEGTGVEHISVTTIVSVSSRGVDRYGNPMQKGRQNMLSLEAELQKKFPERDDTLGKIVVAKWDATQACLAGASAPGMAPASDGAKEVYLSRFISRVKQLGQITAGKTVDDARAIVAKVVNVSSYGNSAAAGTPAGRARAEEMTTRLMGMVEMHRAEDGKHLPSKFEWACRQALFHTTRRTVFAPTLEAFARLVGHDVDAKALLSRHLNRHIKICDRPDDELFETLCNNVAEKGSVTRQAQWQHRANLIGKKSVVLAYKQSCRGYALQNMREELLSTGVDVEGKLYMEAMLLYASLLEPSMFSTGVVLLESRCAEDNALVYLHEHLRSSFVEKGHLVRGTTRCTWACTTPEIIPKVKPLCDLCAETFDPNLRFVVTTHVLPAPE